MRGRLEFLGESALLLRVGDEADLATNARVHALANALREARLDGVDDILPAYASVLVCHHRGTPQSIDALRRKTRALMQELPERAGPPRGKLHRIPVCYGGAFGADLVEVARTCQLTPEEVIRRHVAREYRVAMIGFAPGFPYLIGMDPRLATPRRDTPRTRVPAGSVGIAGAQTGVYPAELPGGWQLIGRTPLTLFDSCDAAHPCLLESGDRVCFESVAADGFDRESPAC